MTDREMIRLCAQADYETSHARPDEYDPLHDDAQAFALLKLFPAETADAIFDAMLAINFSEQNLNRAIVECVAKLQQATTKP